MVKRTQSSCKRYVIYKHISPSKKYYIGQTCQNCVRRWGTNGRNYLVLNQTGGFVYSIFANTILKYGWDNFEHLILYSDLTKEEADILEKKLIQEAKELGLSYNVAEGGTGRESGFHHDLATRESISKSLTGRTLTEEHKQRISNSNKGKRRSQETREKISKSKSSSVAMYSKTGEYIRSFNSLTEAADFLMKTPGHISKCCKGERKSAYGYVWKYE